MSSTVLDRVEGLPRVEHVEELAGTAYAWVASCPLCHAWRSLPRDADLAALQRGREHVASRHADVLAALFRWLAS